VTLRASPSVKGLSVFDFKGFFSHGVKPHLGAFLVVCVVIVLVGGSTIVGLYNKVRAKVPALPAAK
jgi:hypothetical protein